MKPDQSQPLQNIYDLISGKSSEDKRLISALKRDGKSFREIALALGLAEQSVLLLWKEIRQTAWDVLEPEKR